MIQEQLNGALRVAVKDGRQGWWKFGPCFVGWHEQCQLLTLHFAADGAQEICVEQMGEARRIERICVSGTARRSSSSMTKLSSAAGLEL